MKYGPISIEHDHMKGAPLFHGTDVPVKAFFEYLEGARSVERFLNDYPSVNRKDVIEVLQMAKLALTDERILKALVASTPSTPSVPSTGSGTEGLSK